MTILTKALAFVLLGAAAAAEAPASKPGEPAYPYDLGPATVDVSGYPAAQQKNYKLFVQHCGYCHTLARAINAPYAAEKDWKPFVARMHEHSQPLPWVAISHADAKTILDFLVYDSDQRKVRRKADFDAQAKGWQCKLAELQVKRYCAP